MQLGKHMQLFFLIFIGDFVLSDDFYERLGIGKNADDREIRKAFKKKALLLHPDKNSVSSPFSS